MTKQLIQYGNSLALVIDKPILELLNISPETTIEIITDGKNLILSPQRENFEKNQDVLLSLEKINSHNHRQSRWLDNRPIRAEYRHAVKLRLQHTFCYMSGFTYFCYLRSALLSFCNYFCQFIFGCFFSNKSPFCLCLLLSLFVDSFTFTALPYFPSLFTAGDGARASVIVYWIGYTELDKKEEG